MSAPSTMIPVGRASLAALGRALAGPTSAKHAIKRAWRFCANDRVTVSDANVASSALFCSSPQQNFFSLKDGGTGAAASLAIAIVAAELQDGDLIVGGTTGADTITVS